MRPEWRIGNLKTDPIEELVRRVLEEDIPALNKARAVSLGELEKDTEIPHQNGLLKKKIISFIC